MSLDGWKGPGGNQRERALSFMEDPKHQRITEQEDTIIEQDKKLVLWFFRLQAEGGDGVLVSASTVMGLSLVKLARSEAGRAAAALLHLAARDGLPVGHNF